jgi:hypothetical protein
MSQAGTISAGAAGTGNVLDLTGNSGGAVGPNGSGNINILGAGTITVTGNPGTNTLTISESGSVSNSFVTQSGTATPSVGVLNVLGSNGIATSGSGNTLTITGLAASTSQVGVTAFASNAIAALQMNTTQALTPSNITSFFSSNPLPVAQGGTGAMSLTGILIGNGGSPVTGNAVTQYAALVGGASNAVTSVPLTSGQLLIGGTTSPAAATLTAGVGISISNGNNSITISQMGITVFWQTISANQALVPNNGYICISPGGALSLSLPSISVIGDEIEITLDGATSFTITQGASQQIRLGNRSTTAGVGGSLASNAQGDSIRMVCSIADLKWNVVSSIGNLTVI